MKISVRSLRYHHASECLERYQLASWGGVVREGMWRERLSDGREYDSIEDSWVEIELALERLPELHAHVQQLAPTDRPGMRGLLLDTERPIGPVEVQGGGTRQFVGAYRTEWRVTIHDDYMD